MLKYFPLKDILATKMEGEPKVKNIVALAEKVLPNTAPQGKDSIVRETEALRADWEAFVTALQKVRAIRVQICFLQLFLEDDLNM